jgi:hypothetical protein
MAAQEMKGSVQADISASVGVFRMAFAIVALVLESAPKAAYFRRKEADSTPRVCFIDKHKPIG